MAENERFGRQPIQIVEIDQDFCTRAWSLGRCLAGPGENLIPLTDLQDAAIWVSDAASIQRNVSGIDGQPGVRIDFSQSAGSLDPVYLQLDYANSTEAVPTDGNFWFSIDARHISGDTSSVGATLLVSVFDLSSTLLAQDSMSIRPFDGAASRANSSTELTDGWYRFFFEANVTGTPITQPIRVVVEILRTTSRPVLEFARPQLNTEEVKPYRETFGTEKREAPEGTQPCFNTRSTCQDPANYDKGVQVLKFVEKQSPIPTDDYYRPSLKSGGVRVTPAKLNPGGADRNARALGQRASLSVQFQDHPENDRIVDPYRTQREYDPLERGTFWTKWRARNPYYMHRPIRLRSGYLLGGRIVDEITREFVITGFSGPDAQGNVSIQGKDILTLAEDEKAQAPIASTGKLAAAISDSDTSATLTPAGIGDAEYPASGEVRIGKEVMSFTRSGDTLTLTRGQFGTEARAHDEDDTVQLCLRYVSQAPQDILYDLLLNYANIPASYLDKAQWDAEALDFLPRLYSAIITEPNGVSQLISEMCQQMYFTIWWDERLGKVLLKSVRLAQEDEVFELDDQRHLIADSVSWTDLADELITQVWVYYGQIDPTEKLDQGSNYATIAITADPDAEGPDRHNLRRIKTVFSRWIDATNASAAEDLGRRILDRYGNAPRQVTFRVDAKDRYLWLGDYIRLTNRLRVDQFGKAVPVNLQIFQAEEASLGSEFRFTAQEFIPALIGGDQVVDPNERVIPITSDLLNVNLRTLHDSIFGPPTGSETVTFIVREGVTIGGDAAGGGVNVPAGQRVTTNDFYDGGNSHILSQEYSVSVNQGTLPILQRDGIGSVRTTNPGAAYDGGAPADLKIVEYPKSVAIRTGSWPSGVKLNLVVEAGGLIAGEAGNASGHLIYSPTTYGDTGYTYTKVFPGVQGGDGGDAFLVEYPIEITNGGAIYAGGGGGGASAARLVTHVQSEGIEYDDFFFATPGGGGAGFYLAGTSSNRRYTVELDGSFAAFSGESEPAAGARTAPGGGGVTRLTGKGLKAGPFTPIARDLSYTLAGGGGGDAAAPGQAATFSVALDTAFSASGTLGPGGLPGKAVASGASMITWINKGDVRGDEVA